MEFACENSNITYPEGLQNARSYDHTPLRMWVSQALKANHSLMHEVESECEFSKICFLVVEDQIKLWIYFLLKNKIWPYPLQIWPVLYLPLTVQCPICGTHGSNLVFQSSLCLMHIFFPPLGSFPIISSICWVLCASLLLHTPFPCAWLVFPCLDVGQNPAHLLRPRSSVVCSVKHLLISSARTNLYFFFFLKRK